MIDYDLFDNEFSSWLQDTDAFFKEFNQHGLAIEHENRAGLCIAFLLSKISDSLEEITNVLQTQFGSE